MKICPICGRYMSWHTTYGYNGMPYGGYQCLCGYDDSYEKRKIICSNKTMGGNNFALSTNTSSTKY